MRLFKIKLFTEKRGVNLNFTYTLSISDIRVVSLCMIIKSTFVHGVYCMDDSASPWEYMYVIDNIMILFFQYVLTFCRLESIKD
jgi:hypothetical protein